MQAFRIAAVQAPPVFLDRDATVDKAIGLIRTAAKEGAKLIVFPEAFIPGYPVWSWFLKPSQFDEIEATYSLCLEQSIAIPGPETVKLGKVAKELGVHLAIGVSERNEEASKASLYNSIVFIGPNGGVIGRRRKLIPTAAERLVWAQADGSTLGVLETPIARLGGLICWENYMPLARYAMYAGGAEVILSPTWDQSDVWQATMRHVGKEGRAYVVGCASLLKRTDLRNDLPFASALPDSEWLNIGGSVIVDPEGTVIAGPLRKAEGILYADTNPALLRGVKWNLDVAGHYARPDVFEFRVDRSERKPAS